MANSKLFTKLKLLLVLAKLVTASSLSSLPDDCGKNNLNQSDHIDWRIIGGQRSNSSEWPWQVAFVKEIELLDKPFVLMTCGGSLINNNWILTAAHCVYSDADPQSYKVYLGYSDLKESTGNGLKLAVKKIIAHELFNYEAHSYDLALAQLNETLDFGGQHKHLKPICIPDLKTESTDKCYTTGYGWKDQDGKLSDKSLTKVFEPVFNMSKCDHLMDNVNEERNICAGGTQIEGRGTCKGDSGGPLQCLNANGKWYQVGITSWGYPCAHANVPDVFTRVSYYRDWISKNILSS